VNPTANDVESVETHPRLPGTGDVPLMKPAQEVGALLVRPHPGRPSLEVAENPVHVEILIVLAPHPAVDPPAVGPVALDSDPAEAVFLDEAAAQLRPPSVVLVGAVRCLADTDEPVGTHSIDERSEVGRAGQGACQRSDLGSDREPVCGAS